MTAQLPNLTPVLGYPTSLWEPNNHYIQNITQSFPAVVQTVTPHNFKAGIYVRIFLPSPRLGMAQLNQKIFPATILSTTTFSIPVDTRGFEPFTPVVGQEAQALPSAEGSLTLENTLVNATIVVPVS